MEGQGAKTRRKEEATLRAWDDRQFDSCPLTEDDNARPSISYNFGLWDGMGLPSMVMKSEAIADAVPVVSSWRMGME
ncbi:hypothetical protein FQN50_001674 [Emmonsiellopsis sp. PD_5]|nr:hypothetical protein FQN50_001674 [Emmonsiellopsis sp. PD_5]